MFKGAYQRKLLTILYSGGSNPLELWSIQVKNGWTRRVKDDDLGTIVFEIAGTNVATAYIESPPDPKSGLAITLPFINMFIKNLKRYFTFEIQILDDKNMRRRFRFSNYQRATKVRPFACSVPLALKAGWNQMQINLANFTMRAYGTKYMETQRVQIHANCRVRRVYFSDKVYTDEELPRDYRVYLDPRIQQQGKPKTSLTESQNATDKAQSILKITSATPFASETLVTETSYKSSATLERKLSGPSDKKSSRSVHTIGKSITSLSPPEDLLETVDRVVSFVGIQEEKADEVEEAPTDEVTEVVEETKMIEETIPVDLGETTEEELSPRSDVPTESEYAETEPPLESEAEDILEPPAAEGEETASPELQPEAEAVENTEAVEPKEVDEGDEAKEAGEE